MCNEGDGRENLRESGESFGIAGLETQVYNRVGQARKLTQVHDSLNKEQ